MNQKGGSRTETLIKLVLIFVISLLSFSVGTFVGKQFSDSQHKMADLENEFHGHSDRDPASHDDHDQQALSDRDIANLTEEFVNAEKESLGEHGADHHGDAHHAAAKAAEHTAAPQHHQKKEHGSAHHVEKHTEKPAHHQKDAISKAAERVAHDLAPSKNQKHEVRHPTSLPVKTAASTIGKYTVQVASYSTKKEAEAHAAHLKNSGFNAFYLEAQIKGNTWYRVSVGLFSSRQAAKSYKKDLLKQAKLKSALVQKIVR